MYIPRLTTFSYLALALSATLISSAAFAADINVTTFEDNINLEDELCSLREAVISANEDQAFGGCNAGSGADTIILAAGTYILSRSCDDFGGSEVSSSSDFSAECDDLDVYEDLTINGGGKNLTIIEVRGEVLDAGLSANDHLDFRAFDLHSGESLAPGGINSKEEEICEDGCTSGSTLVLKNLQIVNASDFDGGAVRVNSQSSCTYSRLQTENVLFKENYADYNGGAISAFGQVSLVATEFENNEAYYNGGAVYLSGTAACAVANSILTSKFTNNGSGRSGGALFSDSDTSTGIADSSFQGNNAKHSGGAISAVSGSLSLTNSTVSENGHGDSELGYPTTVLGGGIFAGFTYENIYEGPLSAKGSIYDGQGGKLMLLIQNSTVSDNRALNGGGGIAVYEETNIYYDSIKGKGIQPQVIQAEPLIIETHIRDSDINNNIARYEQEEIIPAETFTFPVIFSGSAGGGIINAAPGLLTIETSTFDSNESSLGGAIANFYDLVLKQSTLSNNSALASEFFTTRETEEDEEDEAVVTINFSGGGGVFNAGSADITNATISGNKTDGSGAGIFNFIADYYISFIAGTLDEEIEDEFGLDLAGEPGVRLNNTTIVKNQIVPIDDLPDLNPQVIEGPVHVNNGGGVATFAGTISVANTIIALNTDDAAVSETISFLDSEASELFGDFAPDCYVYPARFRAECENGSCELLQPQIVSEQHNLIGNNLGCSAFEPAENSNNDLVGTALSQIDPSIQELANNGGRTLTHFPNKGSPIIDAASSAQISALAASGKPCEPVDQRNTARPVDGDKDNSNICDIGALEVVADCEKDPNGSKTVDVCGICGGDGSSCAPLSCQEQNILESQIVLDGSAHDLAGLTKRLVNQNRKKLSKKAQRKLLDQSNGFFNKAWNTIWTIPQFIKSSCNGGAQFVCASVSTESAKNSYLETLNELYKLNQSIIQKIKGKKGKKKKLRARYQKINDQYLATAINTLGNVPSGGVNCF